jgi:L-ascorbate metabolism protein UlaG (beta-lactamase superfamily)
MFLHLLLACAPPAAVAPPTETPAPNVEAPAAAVPAAAPTPRASAGPVDLQGTTGAVKVTPVYHGTVRIEGQGLVLWVDPWSKAKLDGPKADILLITDVHFDHLDPAAIAAVVGPQTEIVAPPAVAAELKDRKVTHVLENGRSVTVRGLTIEAVPMYNLVRGPEAGKFFHDKGRGDGFVVTIDGKRVYLAGDTECVPEMKALTNIDLALLPMNLPYTMTPEEAAACTLAFRPKQVTPYHYAGSDLAVFQAGIAADTSIQLVERDAYPGGLPW